MPFDLNYKVTVGSQMAASGNNEENRLLVSLTTQLGMDSGCGYCVLELADSEYTPPKLGDEVIVELDGGEGPTKVFTGEVDRMETIAGAQRITAFDCISKLGRTEVEAVYEEVTIDDIVKDLMQQADVTPGKLDKCPKLPSFVLFKGPGVLQHIQNLARICGKDLYSDGEGNANFTGPQTNGSEHNFEYGLNILDLELHSESPTRDGVEIWGEGAAGSEGANKYYWLSSDLSGLQGVAVVDDGVVTAGKNGSASIRKNIAELRSGESTGDIAEAQIQAVASRSTKGQMIVYGSPEVMPGDKIAIEGLPENHSATNCLKNGSLRIRNVRHILSLQEGFVTHIHF